MLNYFLIESIDNLLVQNNHLKVQTTQQRIKYQLQTMFLHPITETELESIIRNLGGMPSAGFD
jgi:hypothetical protein